MRHGARNTAAEYVSVSCYIPGHMDMNTDNDENGERPVVVVLLFICKCSGDYLGSLVLPLEA